MRIAQTLGVVLLCVGCAAHAQTSPTKLELSKQLVKLLQLDGMFGDDVAECIRAHKASAGAALAYNAHPESFEGLTPGIVFCHW